MRRLKTRAQFQAVLAGTVLARTPHFVLHRLPLPPAQGDQRTGDLLFAPPDVWVGAMLPKRWAKRSVTRHAIKRQIYHRPEWSADAFALHAHVIRLRSSFSTKTFPSAWSEPLRLAVREELALLMKRAASGAAGVAPAPVAAPATQVTQASAP
jgi:ribonuclease P protein component